MSSTVSAAPKFGHLAPGRMSDILKNVGFRPGALPDAVPLEGVVLEGLKDFAAMQGAPEEALDCRPDLLRSLYNAAPAERQMVIDGIVTLHAAATGAPIPPPKAPAAAPPVGAASKGAKVRHRCFPKVIAAARRGRHVWLAGPAGAGKTTLAEHVAEELGRPFLMTGAVASKYDLLGFIDAHGQYQRTTFREAFEHGGVFLKDEIDASAPAALLTVNAALANEYLAFPDGIVMRHPDFVCIAAANTWGHGADRQYVGRNQIDAATLDRFVRVSIDYDETLETSLASNAAWCAFVQKVRAAVRQLGLRVVVSPRATFAGADLIAEGLSFNDAADMTIFDGLPADTVAKIKANIR